jgi:hypothetical protein
MACAKQCARATSGSHVHESAKGALDYCEQEAPARGNPRLVEVQMEFSIHNQVLLGAFLVAAA